MPKTNIASLDDIETIRVPQAEYEAAFYRTNDGYGFPITAFRAATVGADLRYRPDDQ